MNNFKGKIGLMTASLVMMSFIAPSSILARIAEAFPDTPQQTIQMLIAVPNIVSLVTSLLIGRLTPYIYKRYLILIGGLICPICGMLLYFIHPNVPVMIFFMALMGISTGISVTCVAALICDCYDEKVSGRLLGMQAGFISGGAMLFSWLGGQLAKTRWENCFLCYLFVLVLLVIEFICLPKGKLEKRKEKHEKRDPIPKSILFYMFLAFAFGIFIYTFHSNVSMLVDLRNLGGALESSYVSMIYNFAGLVTGFITGIVISRIREYIFSCGLVLTIVGMLFCFLGGQFGLLCLGGILCGASFAVVTPAGNYFASMDSTDYNRSLCIALFNAGSSLGQFVSPMFYGTLLPGLSIEQRFLAASAGLSVLFVVTTIVVTKIRRSRYSV